MKTLGKQFQLIINHAFHKNKKRIGEIAGEAIRSEMFKNVDRGRDFLGQKFQGYAKKTKADRKRGGYQIAKVDFQRSKRRIKDALIRYRAKATEIYWHQTLIRPGYKYTVGQVMYFHQHGMGNNPERNIFPKTPSDIKESVHKGVYSKVRRVLDEPVR